MLMWAEGEPATRPGDMFLVHMDRVLLRDYPLELYDVTVSFTRFEQYRAIEWTILADFLDPPLGHVYGYHLAPTGGGTKVTVYYDGCLADRRGISWTNRLSDHLGDRVAGHPRHPRSDCGSGRTAASFVHSLTPVVR